MTSPSISSANASNQQRAISTIVMGFSSDPVARWIFPEPHQYLTYFTAFVPPFAGQAFEHGSAYCTDNFAAASLWLPPDVHSDQEALGALLPKAVAEADQEKIFAFFEQMGEYHPDRAALVPPAHRGGPGPAGKGLRLGATQARAGHFRPRQIAGVPRSHQPAQPPPLRTARLRGDRRNPGRRLAADVADAPKAALIRPKATSNARHCSVPFPLVLRYRRD